MSAVQPFVLAHVPEAALATLACFAILFTLFTLWARRGRPFPLRPIPAYERLQRLCMESVETGAPLHVTLGSGDWGQATPRLVAGLNALDYVSRQAAASSAAHGAQSLCVTVGNPVGLLLAMNLVQARGAFGGDLHLYGPESLAYAGGAAAEGEQAPRTAHLMLGRFGEEGLWLAEALHYGDAPVLGGTCDPTVAGLIQLSADYPVTGEDLFAAGAYLGRRLHLGSLAAQDWARFLVAITLIGGAILATLRIGG